MLPVRGLAGTHFRGRVLPALLRTHAPAGLSFFLAGIAGAAALLAQRPGQLAPGQTRVRRPGGLRSRHAAGAQAGLAARRLCLPAGQRHRPAGIRHHRFLAIGADLGPRRRPRTHRRCALASRTRFRRCVLLTLAAAATAGTPVILRVRRTRRRLYVSRRPSAVRLREACLAAIGHRLASRPGRRTCRGHHRLHGTARSDRAGRAGAGSARGTGSRTGRGRTGAGTGVRGGPAAVRGCLRQCGLSGFGKGAPPGHGCRPCAAAV
ncbi:hypothetical protein TVNIR_2990 [Thioalkalivibrio nitratireducens DSM 14787]|uniref:Uncharacterized protein n=1 Tax=Thioalkalivibrio nitratireducens (strain DSM 14787 / UNIQEM 213 / ALEN2) TaxID=1255043 RepID=L0E1W3_THIND|nr:hypothetical protein TVNIR_2990 [Thioalkalivibrio nitratireducens DSM 14787]